jgi:multiple sugar transport system substrate-binding protein
MRRFISCVMLSALLLSLLAACGTTDGGSTGASTAASAVADDATGSAAASSATNAGGQKVRLRLATWAGVEEAKELDAILAKINAESQTFEIVQEAQPADYYTKLQTTIAGGQAADLMWLSQEYIPGYAERGALLDLTPYLEQSSEPAAKLDDYFPEVLQTAQFDGKTYGLPWISQPVILYYNPKLFQDAGVAEPTADWTWDDFKAAAEQITNPDQGIYGTAFNDWPPIQMFIWQAGGEVVSEDRTQAPIDTPEALQGIQFYKDIIFNPTYAAPENVIKEQGFGELAKNGKVAMFFGGAADDLDYAHKKDAKFAELKAALVPKGPKSRTTFAWTASTVANAKTANPDVTAEALIKLTEGIHHWKIVAPRKSLANKETIVASVPDKEASADVIVEAAQDMRSFRVVPQQSEWDTIFFETFKDPLYHDKGDPATLAKEARPELEAILQGP